MLEERQKNISVSYMRNALIYHIFMTCLLFLLRRTAEQTEGEMMNTIALRASQSLDFLPLLSNFQHPNTETVAAFLNANRKL